MSTNMTLIETKTVGAGGASSIQFTSIPQTYTDLKLVISARGTTSNPLQSLNLTFNSSRTTNLLRLYAYGSTIASDTSVGNGQGEGTFANGATATANVFSNGEIYIPNYKSTISKSYSTDSVVESNTTTEDLLFMTAGLNSSVTTAITSITLDSNAGNFAEFSTASLYGISAVTSTPKATGGIISQDATYWYHTFPFSSTFTPTTTLSAEYLLIGGGGSGCGGYFGGGGGAGGYRTNAGGTAVSFSSGVAYTMAVGAGGAGSTGNGVKGGNSSISGSGFTTLTSTGGGLGGGGGTRPTANGGTGGSGGGGQGGNSTYQGYSGAGNEGGYTPVEGYDGGNGSTQSGGNVGAGGGGGGAGGAGGNGNVPSNTGGAGGIGAQLTAFANATFTGVNTYYAGGGAGGQEWNGSATVYAGVGGTGGGGVGGVRGRTAPGNGVTNTGSGGGGSGGDAYNAGGSGGSGLVIVRYAK